MTLQEQIKVKEAELAELQKKAEKERLAEQRRIEAEKKSELISIQAQLEILQKRLSEFNKKYNTSYTISKNGIFYADLLNRGLSVQWL